MPGQSGSGEAHRHQAAALSELPRDELLRYGRELGLGLEDNMPSGEIARHIRQRQALLIELDRDALLDVVVWSRRPVRRSAGKEELAREIARVQKTNYESLSKRGLVTLARLRGIAAHESDNAEVLIDRLRQQDGFWKRLDRERRRLVGSLLTRVLGGGTNAEGNDYRFLPEAENTVNGPSRESLKAKIEEHGVVGGLKTHLRSAADDYIRVKMDEIEARIDAKLDEIDRRLGEWRDREVSNRLKILRITLIFTVIVAILSLGYNILKTRIAQEAQETSEQTNAQPLGLSRLVVPEDSASTFGSCPSITRPRA